MTAGKICAVTLLSMNKIIEDDLANVESEVYLMTHTTNPLLTADSIRGALKSYYTGLKAGKDSLFTVNEFQSRFYRADGSALNHDPDNLIHAQDLETLYEGKFKSVYFQSGFVCKDACSNWKESSSF